jgi:hypothetical protein
MLMYSIKDMQMCNNGVNMACSAPIFLTFMHSMQSENVHTRFLQFHPQKKR